MDSMTKIKPATRNHYKEDPTMWARVHIGYEGAAAAGTGRRPIGGLHDTGTKALKAAGLKT